MKINPTASVLKVKSQSSRRWRARAPCSLAFAERLFPFRACSSTPYHRRRRIILMQWSRADTPTRCKTAPTPGRCSCPVAWPKRSTRTQCIENHSMPRISTLPFEAPQRLVVLKLASTCTRFDNRVPSWTKRRTRAAHHRRVGV